MPCGSIALWSPLSVQALQDVLSSDPDEGRRKMGDLSRKTTLLLVNERTLSRRLFLAQDAEKQLRKVSVWSVCGLELVLSIMYFVPLKNKRAVYKTDLL